MGIFTNQAIMHSTGILQAEQQQRYDATKSALVKVFAENEKRLLLELVDLLGESFVKDNLTFHIDRLEFLQDFNHTTVKVPVAPNGANRNEVNTFLVFNTDIAHKRLTRLSSVGRYSCIELNDEIFFGEDLRDIFPYWDRFTN